MAAANLDPPVALVSGVALRTTAALTAGTHPIAAVYSGDANNATSTSNTVNQVVNAAGPAPTTTTLASSLNPSTFGQSVTFTATVTGSGPTGTVQFKDGAANLGAAVTLSAGAATFTTSALSVGSHSITAAYGGDSSNAASTSPVLTQTVIVAPPPSPNQPIPTLSEWSLALLVLLILLAALVSMGMRSRSRLR